MPKKSVDKNHKPLTLNGHSFRIPSDAECLLDGWSTFGVQPIVIEPAEKIEGIPGAFVIVDLLRPQYPLRRARHRRGNRQALVRHRPPRARQGHRRGRPQRRSLCTPDSVLRGIDLPLDLDTLGVVNKLVAYPPLPADQAPEGYPNVLLEDE